MRAQLNEIMCIARSSRLMATDFVRVLFLTDIQNFMQSTKYAEPRDRGAGVLTNISLLVRIETGSLRSDIMSALLMSHTIWFLHT